MRIGIARERKRRTVVNYPILGLPLLSSTVRSQSLCDNGHETLRGEQAGEDAVKRNVFRSLLFCGNAVENCTVIVLCAFWLLQRLIYLFVFFFQVGAMQLWFLYNLVTLVIPVIVGKL